MRRDATVLAVVAVVTAVIVTLAVLDGSGEDPPREDPPIVSPDGLPDGTDALRERIRDSLGRDAAAVVGLGDTRPSEAEAQVDWLRRVRPDLDLAIRSGDPDSGGAALHILAEAVATGVADARTLIAGPGYRGIWLRSLEAEDPKLRAAGVHFLGRLGDEKSRTRIVAMLADASPTVRAAAVHAYGRLAGPGGAARLATLSEGEPDFRVRLAVLDAFRKNRKLRGTDARRIESRAISEGTDAERIQAMANLSQFRDQDALADVVANLSHGNESVRKAALNAVRLLKDRRAVPGLKKYAATERNGALRALAETVLRELSG